MHFVLPGDIRIPLPADEQQTSHAVEGKKRVIHGAGKLHQESQNRRSRGSGGWEGGQDNLGQHCLKGTYSGYS